MGEKISIIIPVYNIENCIARCIESVIGQSYKNLEIILVNDGSTDRSGDICDYYTDERIKVIHKENNGLSSARNAGLDIATGDYIMFLDGDDYISGDMCRILYESLKENSADMSVCSINNIYETGEPIDDFNDASPITGKTLTRPEYYRQLLRGGNWYYIVMWNKLFKKSLFQGLRFPVGKIHEDEFLIHRIVDRCTTISTVTDRLYYYIQRKGSITNKSYSPRRLDVMEALFERERFYIQNKVDDDIVAAHLVASIRVLWATYERADMCDEAFIKRYRILHKECRDLVNKVVFRYKMCLKYRVFLLMNLISLKLTYKIFNK